MKTTVRQRLSAFAIVGTFVLVFFGLQAASQHLSPQNSCFGHGNHGTPVNQYARTYSNMGMQEVESGLVCADGTHFALGSVPMDYAVRMGWVKPPGTASK